MRRIALTLFILGLAVPAQAQVSPPEPEQAAESKEKTNAELRASKSGSVVFGAALVAPTAALDLGVFLTPDLLLEGSVEASLGVFQPGFAVGVQLRAFISDSFNLSGGLSYRSSVDEELLESNLCDDDDTICGDVFGEDKARRETHFSEVMLDVAVGSRWQWDLLVVGVDWIALSAPIYTLSVEEELFDRDSGDLLETRDESDEGSNLNIQLFYVHVGLAF